MEEGRKTQGLPFQQKERRREFLGEEMVEGKSRRRRRHQFHPSCFQESETMDSWKKVAYAFLWMSMMNFQKKNEEEFAFPQV